MVDLSAADGRVPSMRGSKEISGLNDFYSSEFRQAAKYLRTACPSSDTCRDVVCNHKPMIWP